jgi:hypothetical protein
MLYQIRWKHLLTAFLTSGLASTVNIQIPENLQETSGFEIDARAKAQSQIAGKGNVSSHLQARSRSNQRRNTSGRDEPAQTRSNRKNSQRERDEPARTRSSQKLSNPAFRGNRVPGSNTQKNSFSDRALPLPKIQFPSVDPPNPYPTEFTPPPLPKAPKPKTPSYQLPKPRRDRAVQPPEALIGPDPIQQPIGSQDPFTSLNTGKREITATPNDPGVSRATRFVQLFAVSLFGIPVGLGLLKLKKAALPSSSDSCMDAKSLTSSRTNGTQN